MLKVKEQGLSEPEHIFFSGRSAPQIKMKDDRKYHLLDEISFKEKLFELGGTPSEFFQHPELLELFIPLLRNDFELASIDLSKRKITPHSCDISIFLGKDEDMTPEQVDGWKFHTLGICSIYYFNGGHFFLNDEAPSIAKIINNTFFINDYAFQKRIKVK